MAGGVSRQALWEQSYLRHRDGILAYARQWLTDPQAAEDVVQTVFVDYYRQLAQTIIQDPGAYLYQSARHRAINAAQAKRRERDARPLAARHLRVEPDDAARREQAALALQKMQQLPVEQQEVLTLKHFHDLTFKVIAAITGAPHNTVMSRYRLGCEALHKLMAEDDA